MKYSKFFKTMFVITIISSIMSLFMPLFIHVSANYPMKTRLIISLIVMVLVLIVDLSIVWLREIFAKYFNIRNCNNAIRKLCGVSYDEVCEKGPTQFIEKITQYVNNTYMYMTGDAVSIYSSVLIVAAILLIIAFNNYVIAIVLSLSIPFNYFGYKLLNKKLYEKSKVLQQESSEGWQKVISILGQTDYIKQSGNHELIIEKIQPSINRIYTSMADVNILARTVSSAIMNINETTKIMIMLYVVYQTVSYNGDILFLILYTVLLPMFYSKLSALTSLNLNKRDFKISNEFFRELGNLSEADGEKTLDHVYDIKFDIAEMKIKNKVISKDIYGEFQKGDIVFVKGESGKGKSTLMKNLVKFRNVDSILINGTDIREYQNASLRNKVEYLAQSVPIFKGALGDNIFFDIEKTPELEHFVLDNPMVKTILANKSLDSEILENGTNLSGGEKQKIAIVRALCKRSEVLILDEFTSNIDKDTTEEIMNLLLETKQNKIIFIITHDDLPIKYFNKQLVLY